jgi:very-short-patch-repair endonuclease
LPPPCGEADAASSVSVRARVGWGRMRKRKLETRNRARALRGDMPKVEGLLWWKLREMNRNGFHFRRQVPIHGYFADFAEHGAKLVIELDGEQHGADEHRERDILRDRVISVEGYLVMRFWNHDVLRNLDTVVEAILREAERRRPPTRPASPGDLPTRGR